MRKSWKQFVDPVALRALCTVNSYHEVPARVKKVQTVGKHSWGGAGSGVENREANRF